MKKFFLAMAIIIAAAIPSKSSAQLSVNVNIGSQPLWGPTGYDHVEYYYIPDMESYYYVPTREFIYLNNGKWIYSSSRPPGYRNYNLYNGYKVVINSPKPYLHFKEQRVKYAKFKSNRSQAVIRNSNDTRYYQIAGHPKNAGKKHVKSSFGQKSKAQGNSKGNGKSQGRGKH